MFTAPGRNWAAQYSVGRLEKPEALESRNQLRETPSVDYNRPLASGYWASTAVWGRVHKSVPDRVLNRYLLESTLNFGQPNDAFMQLELVDKDDLFPQALTQAVYRIASLRVWRSVRSDSKPAWQLGLGG